MGNDQADLRFAYVTCADLAEAERIGRALIGERLVACVNLLPGLRSLYWWQGRVEESVEIVLIAKTTVARMDAVVARVKSLHSYSTPCVVFLPVVGGNPAFLDWLRGEVAPTTVNPVPPDATTASPPPG